MSTVTPKPRPAISHVCVQSALAEPPTTEAFSRPRAR